MKQERIKISRILVINIFLFLAICGCYLQLHFSTDGYSVLMGNLRDSLIFLQNGRYVAYAMRRIFAKLTLGVTCGVQISVYFTFAFIIASAVCTTLLVQEIVKFADFELLPEVLALLDFGAALTFINGFINDWYGFSDCMDFYALSIVGASVAAVWTSRGNVTGKWIYYLLAFVSLAGGYNSYQISLGLYVFWVMLFIWLHAGRGLNGQMVKDTAVALGLCVATFVSNILLVKVFTSMGYIIGSRYTEMSIRHVWKNIVEVGKSLHATWVVAHKQLPQGVFCGMLILVGVALLAAIFAERSSLKMTVLRIMSVLLVLIGGCGAVYAPHLLQETVWVASRTVVFLFCMFGVLAVMCVFCCRDRLFLRGLLAAYAVFFLLNVNSMQVAASEIYATNATEQTICQQIEHEIAQYEASTGIQITNVGFTNDMEPMYNFPFVTHGYREQAMNSLTVVWNRMPCLNYYSGKTYTEVEIPQAIYSEYFEGRNWDSFVAGEQMVFDDDSVYIAIY